MSSGFIDNALTIEQILKYALLEINATDILYYQTNGYNTDIDTDVEEDIWTSDAANQQLAYLTAADTVYAVSTSTNDDVAGTGAITVKLYGLDGDYNPIQETVTMNGTSATTATTGTFLRVHRAEVITVGSNESNVGAISIKDSGGDTLQNRMSPDRGATGSSHFTVPAGFTGIVISRNLSIFRRPLTSGQKNAEVTFRVRKFGEAWQGVQTVGLNYTGTKTVHLPYTVPFVLPEKTDIKDTIMPEDNNTACSSQTNIVLLRGNFDQNSDIL